VQEEREEEEEEGEGEERERSVRARQVAAVEGLGSEDGVGKEESDEEGWRQWQEEEDRKAAAADYEHILSSVASRYRARPS